MSDGNEQKSDAEMMILNLAMLVRRLCRQLPDENKVKQQASDYLERNALGGSVLRNEATLS